MYNTYFSIQITVYFIIITYISCIFQSNIIICEVCITKYLSKEKYKTTRNLVIRLCTQAYTAPPIHVELSESCVIYNVN